MKRLQTPQPRQQKKGTTPTELPIGTVFHALPRLPPGQFVSNDGKNVLIQKDITPLGQTNNGGESGVDRNGWAVFYNDDNNGAPNIWRATVNSAGQIMNKPLTSEDSKATGAIASTDKTAPSIHVALNRGEAQSGELRWFDEDNPSVEKRVGPFDVISPRFALDTRMLIFPFKEGLGRGQVGLYDTTTGVVKQITDDAGVKTLVHGWRAPEYNNEVLVLAITNRKEIRVYKNNGGQYWDNIVTITIPAGSPHVRTSGVEPFVMNGKSYIFFTTVSADDTDSDVWMVDLDYGKSTGLTLTCDDGLETARRSDPEVYIGSSQAFLYYVIKDKYDMYLCPTGIGLEVP